MFKFELTKLIYNLINFKLLVTMFGNERRDPTLIGAFDPKCDLRKVIEDAADSASHLCEKYYLGSPEVEFEIINGKCQIEV